MMNTHILLFSRSASPSDAHTFDDLLRRWLPHTLPDKYYEYENKKHPYVENELAAFAHLWSSTDVEWTRKKPHVYGWCSPGNDRVHTLILHVFDSSLAQDDAIVGFVTEAALKLCIDYAIAHAVPKKQVPEDDEEVVGVVPRFLPLGLPGVPWLACYGQPYVDVIGKSKLLTAPAYSVQEVGRAFITCQVTEQLSDLWSNRADYEVCRDRVATHLGSVFYKPSQIIGITQPEPAKKRPTFAHPIVERPEVES